MKEIAKYKQLGSLLRKVEVEADVMKTDLKNKQTEYNKKLEYIKSLKAEMESLVKSKSIKVSEHAIVRYLERVKGVNINEIEKELLSNEVVKLVDQLGGTGKYPNNGFTVVMQDYTVTTVIL